MTAKIGIFNFDDRLKMNSLNHRLKRSEVIHSNIANAETPGFRSLGYGFEEQLQSISNSNDSIEVRTTNNRHKKHPFTQMDGKVRPDVYLRPTESIGHDGNTVDLDFEMSSLAQNQLLYRSVVESISRKIGILRYAINGGR